MDKLIDTKEPLNIDSRMRQIILNQHQQIYCHELVTKTEATILVNKASSLETDKILESLQFHCFSLNFTNIKSENSIRSTQVLLLRKLTTGLLIQVLRSDQLSVAGNLTWFLLKERRKLSPNKKKTNKNLINSLCLLMSQHLSSMVKKNYFSFI